MGKSEILREVMSEVDITQSRLSELSGVKQPSLSQMLHDRIEMSDEMLDRLLSCMGYRLEVVRRPVRIELDRSSQRRWRMHGRLVGDLSRETWKRWRPIVLRNLKELRSSVRGEPHGRNLERWNQLVRSNDLHGIRRVMIGLDADSIQMREVSPFGGLLPNEERRKVLEEVVS
jgi:transcriptional regulator with XRE-family HTH domain